MLFDRDQYLLGAHGKKAGDPDAGDLGFGCDGGWGGVGGSDSCPTLTLCTCTVRFVI